MKVNIICFVFCLFVLSVFGSRVTYNGVGLEDGDDTWKIVRPASLGEEIVVRFALYQKNLDVLDDIFNSVSDPKSPKFHQYLTRDEVMSLVSPPRNQIQRVLNWVNRAGCSNTESFGDYIETTCSIDSLEKLLAVNDIFFIEDIQTGEVLPKIISGTYSLPKDISKIVEFVQNLASVVHKKRIFSYGKPQSVYEPSEDQVIPLTLMNLYNISHVITTDSSQNVAEFSNFGYLESDLTAYDTGVDVPRAGPITAVGNFQPSPPNVECTLDVQMITSIGQNGTNFYYTIDGWVLEFAQELLKSDNPPMVNSISWSANERTEGYAYNSRVDTEFQKLGTLGVSVLAASGDDGAVGEQRCSGNKFYFNPGYPATSPYITSVGATMLVGTPQTSTTVAPVCGEIGKTCAISGNEEPAEENLGGYATGGGFSVYETQPSYQSTVVNEYLNDNTIPKPPASYYNPANRGFPDVAANGYNILIYRGGRWEVVGGTSASTPIWGGIFALINDVLIQNGKQTLGFANPFLYQLYADAPQLFNNIGNTSTNNDDGCQYGYTSNPNGWDPVTGLGTPNVGAILNYVQENISDFP